MPLNLEKDDNILLYNKAEDLYEKSRNDDFADFPDEIRKEFLLNGNRAAFEKLYFKRRDYMSATAILALFDDRYIDELEKIILAICSEKSWMLPAHTIHGDDFVDLFIAETAFALAEISVIFADKLSENVKIRIKEEIQNHLTEKYISQTYWWEKCEMNWAAVCGAYVGGTLIYLFPDVFQKHKERILATLNCYINGFTDEGFCLEGPSYWQYGFFAYSVFADLLYKQSFGKDDLFESKKVRNIASYGANVMLKGDTALSISDADENFKPDYALQHFLRDKIPDSVALPSADNLCFYDANTKWMNYYRAIIWQSNKKENTAQKNEVIYSSKAHQLIINKDGFSFAIKGGNNNEPHNHNDLGSFIFSDKDGQVFCDLGAGRYTKDYFDDSKRYSIFCNSSLSHSVPVIDGKTQSAGENFTAKLTYENGIAVCDMSQAYDCPKLKALTRKAYIKENGVVINDSFAINETMTIVERFVSKRQAVVKDGELLFGGTKLKFKREDLTLKISEVKHTPHEYDKDDATVYCYDFILNDGVTQVELEITTE